MPSTRIMISVSLPMDLVASLDRTARAESRSRSGVLEAWLRKAAREGARRELEEATIAYYEGLTSGERREDAVMAAALSQAARRLNIDGSMRRRRRRRRKLGMPKRVAARSVAPRER